MNTSKHGAAWRLMAGTGSLFLLYLWFGITTDQGAMDQMEIHLGPEFLFGFITLVMFTLVPGVLLALFALFPQRFTKENPSQDQVMKVVETTATRRSPETSTTPFSAV